MRRLLEYIVYIIIAILFMWSLASCKSSQIIQVSEARVQCTKVDTLDDNRYRYTFYGDDRVDYEIISHVPLTQYKAGFYYTVLMRK